ncbi:hypothetical protein COPEUT_02083 [Coprococcus eutactus ATCC 27759]|nr:hypothetical protein COPEUT_02083 [Coprococcus eutactus ATCC 27759]
MYSQQKIREKYLPRELHTQAIIWPDELFTALLFMNLWGKMEVLI